MGFLVEAIEANQHRKSGKLKAIIKYLFRRIIYRNDFEIMKRHFDTDERKLLLVKQPNFITKPLTPYISINYTRQDIEKKLINHYEWFESNFNTDARKKIYTDKLVLSELIINDKKCYVTLSFERNSRKEGELTLSLTDDKFNHYYLIAFTVDHNDIYIGCMQGGANDNGFSRLFTKAFYGLRPKSFMVETLRLFANDMNIEHIYAVKNRAHVYTAKRYGKKASTINLNYDQLWQEHNGEEYDDAFYSLPLHTERRAMEDIKRPKRKMYRERYAWLDEYDQDLKAQLDGVTIKH
ncbi:MULTISPECIES: VirK/YbjX family protein [unclassified Photobacterium]|uniref:VirK/YbjX family protein n=1 Tax=unclassified Photobacterium TaxID=2628852 RepID=UPI001EDD9A48|nr:MULTISPECIES: VirK/YbjX family protein [unclassified Photobacterium]MCG3862592.1 DUF535 domain-containing protein [Photobacterium sp. Ph6]MCG3874123.1 DUF535 domain-containing protein [Photobacterium sp. Ph5]